MRTGLITHTVGWMALLEQMKAETGPNFMFTAEAHAELGRRVFDPFKAAFQNAHADDNMHGVRMRLVEKARVFATLSAALRCSAFVEVPDVVFADALVKLFLGHAHSMYALGAGEIYRLALRAESIIKASKDEGVLRRELYRVIRVDKKTMDQALETLMDQGVIYIDHQDRERNGRFVHVDSTIGQMIVAKQEAETKAVLAVREMGAQPWRA